MSPPQNGSVPNGAANGSAKNGASPAPRAAEDKSFAVKLLYYVLEEHRGKINFLIVLPISFVVDCLWTARDWVYETFFTAAHLHDSRVARVQAQVREWQRARKAGENPGKMATDRRPWLTMSPAVRDFKKKCTRITTSDMCDILKIDEENLTVKCEPLVNMGYLTRALLPRGYAIKVQVEMEDITIGGVTMGLGMETDSHRFGLIQECVRSYDIVVASGDLVHARRDNEHAELFACLPWSCGTLGLLVAVEVEMVKIKPYVHCRYIPCTSLDEQCTKLRDLSLLPEGQTPPFLESTVYSRETSVIQCCTPVDVSWYDWLFNVNRVNLWYKPYYYKHLETSFGRTNPATGEPGFEEIIPLRHYYHRYSRSIFWMLRDLIPFSNHPIYRYLFGWLGVPKPALLKFCLTPTIREAAVTKQVVQDIIMPMDSLKEGIELFHDEFDIYPLLVFPIRIYDHGKNQGFLRRPKKVDGVDGPDGHHPGRPWQMYVDLGAYGVPQDVRDKKPWDFRKALLKVEEWTRQQQGFQCIYADVLLTRSEYREMFDHSLYDEVREKLGAADAFPEVYDKIRPELAVCRREDEQIKKTN